MDLHRAVWRKSSYSNGTGGACVEVATLGNYRAVRDSKDTAGTVLEMPATAWSAFTAAVRSGELV